MTFIYKYIITLIIVNIGWMQLINHEIPLSHLNSTNKTSFYNINDILNVEIPMECSTINSNKSICQIGINLDIDELFHIEFSLLNKQNKKIFILNSNNKEIFSGPYYEHNQIIQSKPLNMNSIIIEVNISDSIKYLPIQISSYKLLKRKYNIKEKSILYKRNNQREEPTILVTGYWPPTNEMIRHFSQNESLNPNGWQGDNWENRGYDIISYFPEFSNPDCSSCGQGFGDIEVDYQDTSEDFWPIANQHNPIAIITFSRGYMDQSWELEYNAYNRTNWYNDFTSPFQPTPNPPDSNEDAFHLRNSNLPMDQIVGAISELDIGLNPYIDINGDPGRYVSEFMAYHGTWYRDLNQFNNIQNCISAGHIHVGGYIDWDTAKIATEESIRVLINQLDSFIYTPGDLNQDSIIDILDLVIVINFILGDIELSSIQIFAADLNEDSIINIQDIIMIINIILN
ncbi:MAG: hypothetical protein CMG66_00750 [Candidatus Marinimicrobia bacterium]|nr:hypothetical protein [Candidatus Neomarinimicrobiota bacterium]